jgi:hypothetical protein
MISSAGVFGSWHWFGPSNLAAQKGTGEPIAYLLSEAGAIERRSSTQVVWQTLGAGEALFAGDGIRTPPTSEGNVKLVLGDTTLVLEPDSLIVLTESSSGLELDLLNGSLFLDGQGSKESIPSLKVGDTKITMDSSGGQINVTNKVGSAPTIAVSSGHAAVAVGTKTVKVDGGTQAQIQTTGLNETPNLEVLAPTLNSQIDLTPGRQRITPIRWQADYEGSSDHVVQFWMGTSRSNMTLQTTQSGATGQILANIKNGVFYWQLVAVDSSGAVQLKSMVRRNVGVYLRPPKLIGPEVNAEIYSDTDQQIKFSWTLPEATESVRLEVSASQTFEQPIVSEALRSKAYHVLDTPDTGTYYWRVAGIIKGKSEPILSDIRPFIVKPKLTLPQPNLQKPQDRVTYSGYEVRESGIELTWDRPQHVKRSHLLVTNTAGNEVVNEQLTLARYRAKTLAPGAYQWKVRFLSAANNAFDWSAPRTFTIKGLESIAWDDLPEIYRYTTDDPTVQLKWQPSQSAASWRVRYASTTNPGVPSNWQEVDQNVIEILHPKSDTYIYEVQALDGTQRVVAMSEPRQIKIEPIPPLAPPVLAEGDSLKADDYGKLHLKWSEVEGAKGYQLTLTKDEVPLKTVRTDAPEYLFTSLMPGEFQLKLQTTNQRNVEGAYGQPYALTVPIPKISSIKPTTLKSFAFDPKQLVAKIGISPVKGAKGYEGEIVGDQKSTEIKMAGLNWSGVLPPGDYTARFRSIDQRQIPGIWGKPADFSIPFPEVKGLTPFQSQSVASPRRDQDLVTFSWAVLPGPAKYLVEVFDVNDKRIAKKIVKNFKTSIKLPIGADYTWKVTALTLKDKPGAKWASNSAFTLTGGPLASPKIDQEFDGESPIITWTKPPKAQFFPYELAYRKTKKAKWTIIDDDPEFDSNELEFSLKQKKGFYQLTVSADSEYFEPSEPTIYEFEYD